jgi:hypothetical protein
MFRWRVPEVAIAVYWQTTRRGTMIAAMHALLRVHDGACSSLIRLLLWLAVVLDEHRRRVARRMKRWRKRVRAIYMRWLSWRGLVKPPTYRRGHPPWNKTPEHIEEQVVRLHVEHPYLGAGQLGRLAERVLGFSARSLTTSAHRPRALARRRASVRRIVSLGFQRANGADFSALIGRVGTTPGHYTTLAVATARTSTTRGRSSGR